MTPRQRLPRVAVIGAGVVGACCAYYLARAGIDVLIVEADRPGQLTTGASFAWVNASAKADHPAYFDLNFAGLQEYERLAADLAPAPWWNPTGHLRWDYRDEEELTRAVETMTSRGYPAEIWDVARARRLLEPQVAFANTSRLVALFGTEGWVDGPGMAQALVDAAARNGAATAFGSPVHAITTTAGAVASLTLANGETHAVDRVVNAAGPAAAGVAALLGRRLPMKDSPGLVVRVNAPSECVRRVLHAPGLAIRPDGRGRVVLLARAVERDIGDQSNGLAADVCRLAAGVVPALARATVTGARIGRRPIPGDGLPAIGKASDVEGYYEAVTHSGITLGPIIGRALATEIVHGEIDPLVSSFRASRFG
ncbi:MAG: NAD(P)/FAD-dependent oxidoreductase [Solirubrobacteraceae bacterium]